MAVGAVLIGRVERGQDREGSGGAVAKRSVLSCCRSAASSRWHCRLHCCQTFVLNKGTIVGLSTLIH